MLIELVLIKKKRVSGAQTEDETFKLYETAKKLMLEAGFQLRKWVSNDSGVQQRILQSEREICNETENFLKNEMKVLGVSYRPKDDKLVFSVEEVVLEAVNHEGLITKRFMVKVTAKYYDPSGILAPITIQFKILIQEACKLKLSWDEEVTEELTRRWIKLLRDCVEMKPIVLDRHYLHSLKLSDIADIQLHGFADASGKAYACVIYLRVTTKKVEVFSSFVSSKTKVAPIKQITFPRLELMACLILIQLVKVVLESVLGYKIETVFCWTDNTDCLSWITREDKVRVKFVQKRADKIRTLFPTAKWLHCPGKINPADIPSRGLSLLHDDRVQFWCNGPDFLKQPYECWPKQPDLPATEEDSLEDSIVSVNVVTSDVGIDKIIDPNSFFSFCKLVAVTSYVIRFVTNWTQTFSKPKQQLITGELSQDEKKYAKLLWLRKEQESIDEKHMKQLKYNLGAYRDEDGVIKLKGRLENADIDISAKFPVLIPKNSMIGQLLISDAHTQVLHYGMKDTLTELRSEYWLVQGRSHVEKFVDKCRLCRKFEGKLLKKLPAAPLPDFRVQCCDPFTHVGVDYIGPLHVSPTPSSTKTGLEKVHIVLYTCANTLAVHLDLVPDTSCSAFIGSLKRFIGRRGVPDLFISDNAKCFIGKELISFLNANDINWKYILEVSPWWGGFYERMVQTVKRSLRKI